MSKFMMLVGVSGCGKSTIAAELAKDGTVIYSSDAMREEMWGNAEDQQQPGVIFDELNKRTIASLKAGIDVIYDATNLSAKRRTSLLRHIERNSLLLFMVPADADDIKKEYEILLGELVKYNPDLQDKTRVLAITKSDMLDDELIQALSEDLPEGIPYVFISSVAGKGIVELKDLLWKELNKETFHEVERIVHKNMDVSTLVFDEEDYIIPIDEEDLDDEEYEEYEDWDEESDD